jgi:hypothetical protein
VAVAVTWLVVVSAVGYVVVAVIVYRLRWLREWELRPPLTRADEYFLMLESGWWPVSVPIRWLYERAEKIPGRVPKDRGRR